MKVYLLFFLILNLGFSVTAFAVDEAEVKSTWKSSRGETFSAIHKNTEDDQCLNIKIYSRAPLKIQRICSFFDEQSIEHRLSETSVQDVTFGDFSWKKSELNFDFDWLEASHAVTEIKFKCHWDASKLKKSFLCKRRN